MAAIQPDHPDQRSSSLSLNLSSNNPFRNRAASPNIPSNPSPFDDPAPAPARPISRNPFLDPSNQFANSANLLDMAPTKSGRESPTAEDLFGDLTLEEKQITVPARPPPMNRPGQRENMPPAGRKPPPNHRPSRSQEEAMRARRVRDTPSTVSPQRKPNSRVRRNSESSVADRERPSIEEDRKAREQRHRDRERRHRERGDRDRKDKPKPSNKKLDIIDRLDATSIYGTGLFHHDGPYDALNSHRNRSRRAPMEAFPKDSLNMALGGSGPLNARPDHAAFMGNADPEAFEDYSTGAIKPNRPKNSDPALFDPKGRGSILHGDPSLGLGTSTFLEGTPAARKDIERHQQETQQEDNGLQRKKSLAQRIRNINRTGPRDFQGSGRLTNPDGLYSARRSPSVDFPTSMSSTGAPRSGERNPFFEEYDTKKGEEQISVRRANAGSPSPTRAGSFGLERRTTSDAAQPVDDQPKQGSGLLARVKSLKGGRRRPSENQQPPHPGAAA